jgi:hypothetical protein
MLELLRTDLVYALALASLLILLFGPVAGVWVVWSIRRDIHRIADALEVAERREVASPSLDLNDLTPLQEAQIRGVANSAFGR